MVGTLHLEAEQLLDLGAVLVLDRRRPARAAPPACCDVLVRVDPADLGVDARELGGVTARERGVGAEGGRDLEDLAEPGDCAICLKNCGDCAR